MDRADESRGGILVVLDETVTSFQVYRHQIVDAADGRTIATFNGKGPVEGSLSLELADAIKREIPMIAKTMQARGRWWLRPAKFDAALQAALRDALPDAAMNALHAVLRKAGHDAVAKHAG